MRVVAVFLFLFSAKHQTFAKTPAPTPAPTPAVGSNPVCIVCGDPMKIVTLPDVVLNFPGQALITCSQLVKAGQDGQINYQFCPWLSTTSGVPQLCGCADATITPFLSLSAAPSPPAVSPSQTSGSLDAGAATLAPAARLNIPSPVTSPSPNGFAYILSPPAVAPSHASSNPDAGGTPWAPALAARFNDPSGSPVIPLSAIAIASNKKTKTTSKNGLKLGRNRGGAGGSGR